MKPQSIRRKWLILLLLLPLSVFAAEDPAPDETTIPAVSEEMCREGFEAGLPPRTELQVPFGVPPVYEVPDFVDDYHLFVPHVGSEGLQIPVESSAHLLKPFIGDYKLKYAYRIPPDDYFNFLSADGVELVLHYRLILAMLERDPRTLLPYLHYAAALVRNKKSVDPSFFASAPGRDNSFRRVQVSGFKHEPADDDAGANAGKVVLRVPIEAVGSQFNLYRYFVRRERRAGDLLLVTCDTEISADRPAEVEAARNSVSHSLLRLGAMRSAEERAIRNGLVHQTKMLREIHSTIFPVYRARGWSDELIEEERQLSFATVNATRYTIAYSKNKEVTEVAAMIGVYRAPFGMLIFYNSVTEKWERRLGPAETAYASTFGVHVPWFHRSSSEADSKMMTSIPRLPTEAYFGPNYWLPRSATLEVAERPSGGKLIGIGQNGPMLHGVYRYTGQIEENVKFFVRKGRERKKAYASLLTELARSAYSNRRSPQFNLSARKSYASIDKRGSLYTRMGYSLIDKKEDGKIEWDILVQSPERFLELLSDGDFLNDRAVEDFLFSLQEQVARIRELHLRK